MSVRNWGKVANNFKNDEYEFPPLNASEFKTQDIPESKEPVANVPSTQHLNVTIAPDEYVFTPTAELMPTCINNGCSHYFRFPRHIVRKLFPHDGRVKSTCELMETFDGGLSPIELTIPCAMLRVLHEYASGLREDLPSIYIHGGMNDFIPPMCRQFGGTNLAYLTTYLGLDVNLCYDADINTEDDDNDIYDVPPQQNYYNMRQDILSALPRDVCDVCLKQKRACECDEPYVFEKCCNKKVCSCGIGSSTDPYCDYYEDDDY